jgi:hypothetical protein
MLAIPSFKQAKKAKGNLFCEVKHIEGYQCSLTAWESREWIIDFLRSGPHLKAMKSFHKIAIGKTQGYKGECIPSWDEAFALLQKEEKSYE